MFAVFDRDNAMLSRVKGFDHEVNTDSRTFYFIGTIDGLVQNNYTVASNIEVDDVVSNLDNCLPRVSGRYAGLSIRDGVLQFAASDISAVEELYYTLTETELLVSTDFFELALAKGPLEYDVSDVRYFIERGLCHKGKTTFSEVYRLPPGEALQLDTNGGISTHNYLNSFRGAPVTFDVFKNAISNSANSIIQNDPSYEEVVMFSGGVDSSVLLSLVKNIKDVTAVTYRSIPPTFLNEPDVIRSARIAKKLQVPHEFIDVDLNEIDLGYIDDVVVSMPFAPHYLGVCFKKVFEQLHKQKKRLWCGQNLDTLYNYTETYASAKSIINRFMLSDAYGRMLKGVNGHEKYKPAKKALDFSLRSLCHSVYRQRIATPNTIEELVQFHSEFYPDAVRIIGKQNECQPRSLEASETINARDIRKILFDEELGGFFTGRDNKIQLQAKKLFNVESFLLYSMPNTVHLLRNMNLSWPDVIFPKRFVYRYARELGLSKSDFNIWEGVSAHLPARKGAGTRTIGRFSSTSLGAELHRKAKESGIRMGLTLDATGKYQSQKEMAIYWINNVREKLNQIGVAPKWPALAWG